MPSASTRIGSRFENWERAIIWYPVRSPIIQIHPIEPCIQSNANERPAPTIKTSETRRRLIHSRKTTTTPMIPTRKELESNSRLISTFGPSPSNTVTTCSSVALSSPQLLGTTIQRSRVLSRVGIPLGIAPWCILSGLLRMTSRPSQNQIRAWHRSTRRSNHCPPSPACLGSISSKQMLLSISLGPIDRQLLCHPLLQSPPVWANHGAGWVRKEGSIDREVS